MGAMGVGAFSDIEKKYVAGQSTNEFINHGKILLIKHKCCKTATIFLLGELANTIQTSCSKNLT